jgi:hypothetical protein
MHLKIMGQKQLEIARLICQNVSITQLAKSDRRDISFLLILNDVTVKVNGNIYHHVQEM